MQIHTSKSEGRVTSTSNTKSPLFLQDEYPQGFVPLNRPTITGAERSYVEEVFKKGEFAGGGRFSNRCDQWLKNYLGAPAALTTTSGTHALEMAAMLCFREPGDEVILPSFTFPSTATAFVRSGFSLVFVDVEPSTMNIDWRAVEAAITSRTRVVVVVHYGGRACNMNALGRLAREKGLTIVEDAAQALCADYRAKRCGAIGRFGCISFHESKNIHCGEGGALVVNDAADVPRAEILREKGTDRSRFFRGEIDKYRWQDVGSSYVLSELNAAFLLAQLEHSQIITSDRLRSWNTYRQLLTPLAEAGLIEIPPMSNDGGHNGHIFWVKARSEQERDRLMRFLRRNSLHSVFHYVPLHSAPAGLRFGRLAGLDRHTTDGAGRLLRLPIFYGFKDVEAVAGKICEFYGFA